MEVQHSNLYNLNEAAGQSREMSILKVKWKGCKKAWALPLSALATCVILHKPLNFLNYVI
jgi:hypothetical protein